jgi:hypothetical protein
LRSGLRAALSRRIRASFTLIGPEIKAAESLKFDPDVTAELFASMIFRLARLGRLPATPKVTAVHLLVTWVSVDGITRG